MKQQQTNNKQQSINKYASSAKLLSDKIFVAERPRDFYKAVEDSIGPLPTHSILFFLYQNGPLIGTQCTNYHAVLYFYLVLAMHSFYTLNAKMVEHAALEVLRLLRGTENARHENAALENDGQHFSKL